MAKVIGFDKVLTNVNLHIKKMQQRAEAGLKEAGLLLLKASQEIVPKDYGKLYASGHVVILNPGTSKVTMRVLYGGPDAPYAIIVHENPDALHGQAFNIAYAAKIAANPATGPYRHPRRPRELYKFLETPYREHLNDMKAIVLAKIRG